MISSNNDNLLVDSISGLPDPSAQPDEDWLNFRAFEVFCSLPALQIDMGRPDFVIFGGSMNSATDTIMGTGPAEVEIMGMTYRITAFVAPEDLHASCVIFSKNLLWFLLFGGISRKNLMVAGVGNRTTISALFAILGLEKKIQGRMEC